MVIFISIFIVITGLQNSAMADNVPALTDVKSAIAVDANSGQILYETKEDEVYPVASMSKLLTAYILLDKINHHELSWNTKVKPTKVEAEISHNSELTNVPLNSTHSYTIRELYQAMLVGSANATAMVIARAVSGSQTNFVKLMRVTAKNMGIKDAKLYSANGLPTEYLKSEKYPGANKNSENELSAQDMAIIATKLIKDYPEILNTTKLQNVQFNDRGKTTSVTNTNKLLSDNTFQVDGLKTGTSDAAGECITATTSKYGSRIITVIIGANSDSQRFEQTKLLLNNISNSYNYTVIGAGQPIPNISNVKILKGKQKALPIAMQKTTGLWLNKEQGTQDISAKFHPNSEIIAPIKKYQNVGKVTLTVEGGYGFLNGKDGMTTSVSANKTIDKANILVRLWRDITKTN